MLTIQNYTKEIKYLFVYLIISITLTTLITYTYSYEILYVISKPIIIEKIDGALNNNKFSFILTDLFEAFKTYIILSIISSIILNIPFLIWNIWKFLIKGLYIYENKILVKLTLLFMFFLIIMNILFYKTLFPVIINFLTQFENTAEYNPFNLQLQLKLREYFNIFIKLILIYNCMLIFPLILVFFKNIKWIYYKKYIYLILLITLSIITPPDILSLLLLMIPSIIVLEITHLIKKMSY